MFDGGVPEVKSDIIYKRMLRSDSHLALKHRGYLSRVVCGAFQRI